MSIYTNFFYLMNVNVILSNVTNPFNLIFSLNRRHFYTIWAKMILLHKVLDSFYYYIHV